MVRPRRSAGKKRRAGKKKKKGSARITRLKVLLLALMVPVLVGGGFALYYYAYFNRLIDARIKTRILQEGAIYSAPPVLHRGQRVDLQELRTLFSRLGYQPGLAAQLRYVESDHGFELIEEGQKVEVRITSDGRVSDLLDEGKRVERIELPPLFLSNLYDVSRQKKRFIPFEELPDQMVSAVLAAEDARFFSHSGLDPLSIARALFVNLRRFSQSQGGSTITQQFVKNFFLTQEKTVSRKLQEAYLAVLLEQRLNKKEIFELYANEVYLGQRGSFAILGFSEGAWQYFGKPLGHLTLPECALLAGLIQAPNRYDPVSNPSLALRRRNHVLDLMEENGFITTNENARASQQPVEVASSSHFDYSEAPYFVDHVRKRLSDFWDGEPASHDSAIEIYTTLELTLQKAAFNAISDGIQEVEKQLRTRGEEGKRVEAALLAVRPDQGSIVAMVGGRRYENSQFNRVTRAFRQPGSTFKPFVFAAAIELSLESDNPITLSSFVNDEPHTFHYQGKEYAPHNFRDQYLGTVTLRQALAQSLNVSTMKLAEFVGYPRVAAYSSRLGFSRDLPPYPSTALGSAEVSLMELTHAYTTLVRLGERISLRDITFFRQEQERIDVPTGESVQIMSPETAFLVTSALQTAVDEGTGRGVRNRGFRLPVAGKTGSDNDSWFVGYTPDLVCGVWVGYDDGSDLGLTGSQAALPVWTRFMKDAASRGALQGRSFPVPDEIVSFLIDPETGLLASDQCDETITEYYIMGTEPQEICSGEEEQFELVESEFEKKKERRGVWGWIKSLF